MFFLYFVTHPLPISLPISLPICSPQSPCFPASDDLGGASRRLGITCAPCVSQATLVTFNFEFFTYFPSCFPAYFFTTKPLFACIGRLGWSKSPAWDYARTICVSVMLVTFN